MLHRTPRGGLKVSDLGIIGQVWPNMKKEKTFTVQLHSLREVHTRLAQCIESMQIHIGMHE